MPTKIDVRRIGMLVRGKRDREGLTLNDVAERTGLKIPTLSRVERGAAQDLNAATLLTLTRWLGADIEDAVETEPIPPAGAKVEHTTPDVVELYLRADKNLDKTTAEALSSLFRTAYAAMSKQMRAKNG